MKFIDVSNADFFRRFLRLNHTEKLRHAGEPMIAEIVTDPVTDIPKSQLQNWSAIYLTDCQFCKDGELRRSASAPFRQRGAFGCETRFAVTCRNWHCLKQWVHRDELTERQSKKGRPRPEVRVGRSRICSVAPADLMLTKSATRLDEPPKEHSARAFVAELPANPDRAGCFYRVGFCAHDNASTTCPEIGIPAGYDGKRRGWQMRSTEGEPACPKRGCARRVQLHDARYHFDFGRRYRTDVLLATPIDVCRFVALAFSCLDVPLAKLGLGTIARAFRDRRVVVIADESLLSQESRKNLISFLAVRLRGRVMVVDFRRQRAFVNRGFPCSRVQSATENGDF